MRNIPIGLQTKLDSGVTTLCTCHIVERKDGVMLGFTDHDRDIAFNGVTCLASTGFSSSEITERLGFSISGGEIAGGLIDDSLSEADILNGLYDGAHITIWLVDWSEQSLRVLLRSGTIGEIVREGLSFRAEIRSKLSELDSEKGRSYLPTCSALVGDSKCKVTLNANAGTVTTVLSNNEFKVSGLSSFATNWFTQGKLTWVTGANTGNVCEVHYFGADTVILRQEMPLAIALGDQFNITVGCDKRFSTCKTKFNNIINFRGFPHIPGNDFLSSYPLPGVGNNDGGSL